MYLVSIMRPGDEPRWIRCPHQGETITDAITRAIKEAFGANATFCFEREERRLLDVTYEGVLARMQGLEIAMDDFTTRVRVELDPATRAYVDALRRELEKQSGARLNQDATAFFTEFALRSAP